MQGRHGGHFLSLLGQARFHFGFGSVTSGMGWLAAVLVRAILSIFENMSEAPPRSQLHQRGEP
eukprot:2629727-Heterocapsa_arctica.AAC.1